MLHSGALRKKRYTSTGLREPAVTFPFFMIEKKEAMQSYNCFIASVDVSAWVFSGYRRYADWS